MLQHALQLGRSCFQRLILTALAAALALGCSSTLQERTVSDVNLIETAPSKVDLDDALAGLATAAPRTFLWVERERDVYDANLVAHDLERIERFYRARGYYDVKVVAARVESVGERKVEIEVYVTPGAQVTVRKVTEDQAALLSLPPEVSLKKFPLVAKIASGKPFDEDMLDKRKQALEEMLKEAGYAYAKVRVTATVDLNAHAADIVTEMHPGKPARFGEIRIVGLKQLPEEKVRAALELKRGDPYSEEDQVDARDALGAMQLFTRIEVTPDLSNPDVEDVPILVTLQEDQLRKLVLGGGTVIDALKLEMHVRTGWEHKNFLGGARRLRIELTGGADLYPWRLERLSTLAVAPKLFPIVDASVMLEQPALFNGRTQGSVQTGYSMRPVLYSLGDADPRTELVIGYHQPHGQVALGRAFLGQRGLIKPSYNLQARVPFMYQGRIPDGLQTVWTSYPKLEAVFQSFNGDIFQDRTKREFALSFRNSLEIAGLHIGKSRLLGGSVSDVKIEPEVRVLFPLRARRRNAEQKAGDITLAGRVKFGFLLAPDYGSTLRTDQAAAIAQGDQTAQINSDQQKLLSRAFYSGGANSNRGYAQMAISPHGPVGFLVPTSINCIDNNDARCTRPLGGFTQWEASIELRYAGLYPLTLALFADAADVTRDVGRLQFNYPHLSVGPGLRYESPVGPIRLDFGFRVPGAQAWGKSDLPLSHGQERPRYFGSNDPTDHSGIPLAIHLAIGEVY